VAKSRKLQAGGGDDPGTRAETQAGETVQEQETGADADADADADAGEDEDDPGTGPGGDNLGTGADADVGRRDDPEAKADVSGVRNPYALPLLPTYIRYSPFLFVASYFELVTALSAIIIIQKIFFFQLICRV